MHSNNHTIPSSKINTSCSNMITTHSKITIGSKITPSNNFTTTSTRPRAPWALWACGPHQRSWWACATGHLARRASSPGA